MILIVKCKGKQFFCHSAKKTAPAHADAVILMFLLLAFYRVIEFKVGLNNHLININYHQKILFFAYYIYSNE